MFRKILVPLDGSRFAEAALPVARWFADRFGSQVTLLHVIEHKPPSQVHGERHLTQPDEAATYLDATAASAFGPGQAVAAHVHTISTARVAHTIAEHRHELAADLIVMCGHGRSGLRDLLFGSIAQRVSTLGKIPVLFVRARAVHAPTPFRCDKLLVPTDGEPYHEKALSSARGIASVTGAQILLLSVVPTWSKLRGRSRTSARMMPGTTLAALEIAAESLREHLGELASELRQEGLDATAEVHRGDPATSIVETAGETRADLIVMATHGKIGASAFWEGSVTPKVLADTVVSVLLVPV
jgi:nucleotide-binding universal stress UspA family protein